MLRVSAGSFAPFSGKPSQVRQPMRGPPSLLGREAEPGERQLIWCALPSPDAPRVPNNVVVGLGDAWDRPSANHERCLRHRRSAGQRRSFGPTLAASGPTRTRSPSNQHRRRISGAASTGSGTRTSRASEGHGSRCRPDVRRHGPRRRTRPSPPSGPSPSTPRPRCQPRGTTHASDETGAPLACNATGAFRTRSCRSAARQPRRHPVRTGTRRHQLDVQRAVLTRPASAMCDMPRSHDTSTHSTNGESAARRESSSRPASHDQAERTLQVPSDHWHSTSVRNTHSGSVFAADATVRSVIVCPSDGFASPSRPGPRCHTPEAPTTRRCRASRPRRAPSPPARRPQQPQPGRPPR
jgi:hypothetical protein